LGVVFKTYLEMQAPWTTQHRQRPEIVVESVTSAKRILIVCYQIELSGGLLRFERTGRELAKLGHRIAYVFLADSPNPQIRTDFDILPFDRAATQTWDLTMVPGAGFPEKMRDRLDLFVGKQYGLRIQHILNAPVEPDRRKSFLHVNRRFNPDIVVFNNRHWEPGSFTDFQGRKFAFLEGAVDCAIFFPIPGRRFPHERETRTIGGLSNKNPEPLLRAIESLPEYYRLRLYGKPPCLTKPFDTLLGSGRVEFLGPITEERLPYFYANVDCVVHTEKTAGWANLGAEALASGIPLICTKWGTLAFAEHEKTALILDEPTSDAISTELVRLFSDKDLACSLAQQGRQRIIEFTWDRYAKSLLEICEDDGKSFYTYAPEFGLHGKWPLLDRLKDIDLLFERVEGMSIIDFGDAEGVIALECLKRGAAIIHGFDLDSSRVDMARELCRGFSIVTFRKSDLSDWSNFCQCNADLLLDSYDIVLFLGIQHHLPQVSRVQVLKEVAKLAKRFLLIRTTAQTYQSDNIVAMIEAQGLKRISLNSKAKPGFLGGIIAFERASV
jgi:glycosyltransferase involved in cell wall biosynthesis